MSSFAPHNNFDNFRNFLHLFEKEKQVCAPDFVEGPHQRVFTMLINFALVVRGRSLLNPIENQRFSQGFDAK